jgi:hypothetical protein
MSTPFPRLPAAAALFATLLATSNALAANDAPLGVQFSLCTEFVGLAPVNTAGARALVPARYNVVTDISSVNGATLVVRVTDCKGVKVGGLPARAGRVAQIGVLISSPDGTATDPNTSINNYTISYASNVPALVLGLLANGVPAVLDVGLAYEFAPASAPTGTSELYAAVSPELDTLAASPTWFLHGSVKTPGFNTTFLANWWRSREGGANPRQVKMSSTFPAIAFDFSSVVSFTTSRLNTVGKLLPAGNQVASFPISFRGAYDAATMVVSSAP